MEGRLKLRRVLCRSKNGKSQLRFLEEGSFEILICIGHFVALGGFLSPCLTGNPSSFAVAKGFTVS